MAQTKPAIYKLPERKYGCAPIRRAARARPCRETFIRFERLRIANEFRALMAELDATRAKQGRL